MTETTYSIVEARARLGAIAREVSATREQVAITDHGQTVAILVSPADALELPELRALAAFRARKGPRRERRRAAQRGIPPCLR
ncbi:type II toxin-antitoxin system Phd/YefM family antitoxin [Streptomyces sp. NPDC051776]|uniref:type II toxin-antitoxin system Phd/YefM family antitoxin n=1 Tax=Streptomyces sp. NPDC051776 TaxID=3155414 RepID=UPI00343D23C8